ncbi:MAG: hypothetical protein HY923_06685 [Elusimicrobia bacterium]|nr:hypothetical protein [Elusimicrobiota bacterium]
MSDAAVKPWLTVTPAVAGRMALSTVLMAIGMYYLVSGRKEANVSRMFTGALLALASVFLFI